MLPLIKKVKMPNDNFPTKWQAVIFRNYGLVSVDKIAKTLGCDIATVEREAVRLGLGNITYDGDWEKRGYITLIRNNWFLLPYSQILTLLDITEEKLDFYLEKEDFLSVKLGNFKPECDEIYYTPLTEEQIEKTAVIADMVASNLISNGAKPFDFFAKSNKTDEGIAREIYQGNVRIIHGYLAPCGDVFAVKNEEYLPENLLQAYQEKGINGVWLHGLLSALSPYPFDENASAGYLERRAELKRAIARCKKYGIKIYLYLNEPRALAEDKFGKYSHLIGRKENGVGTLCLEREETQAYLLNATKDLLADVQDLGGFITITMSENPTHCNYLPNTNCPICKNIPPEESAAKVNNILMRAIKESGSNAELIANLWGWSPFMEWTEAQTQRGVELLDKDISVMCVSEYDLDIEKGGVQSRIIDYSISNPGPSDITKRTLKKAQETGHKLYAKIQINNSWECSAAPYLPAFDLTYQHLCNLQEIGVDNYMLTWTLGGYPSPVIDLAADFSEKKQAFDLDKWYEKRYGGLAKEVHTAVEYFCKGFQEYPFSIQSLYLSPKTLGVTNFWSLEKEEKGSTMVCFAYDDYQSWITPYPYEIYISQYEKLLKAWGQGCVELEKLPSTAEILEMKICAKTSYLHFKADYLQTQFSYYKMQANATAKMQELIKEDIAIAKELLTLISQSALVGFEASNHYFYHQRNVIEKIINLNDLLKQLS